LFGNMQAAKTGFTEELRGIARDASIQHQQHHLVRRDSRGGDFRRAIFQIRGAEG
jgi:hypothetical protein